MNILKLLICSLLIVGFNVNAQEPTIKELYPKAKEAYIKGDYQLSYEISLKLAELGDDRAKVQIGVMHHQGLIGSVDYSKALDWYLKAIDRDGDALNNIGVMFRDGSGVEKNRKISYLLFLTVHMTGLGTEDTVMRANRNLRREVSELPKEEREESLCYTLGYMKSYIQSKGTLKESPKKFRLDGENQFMKTRVKDLNWWLPNELETITCSENS